MKVGGKTEHWWVGPSPSKPSKRKLVFGWFWCWSTQALKLGSHQIVSAHPHAPGQAADHISVPCCGAEVTAEWLTTPEWNKDYQTLSISRNIYTEKKQSSFTGLFLLSSFIITCAVPTGQCYYWIKVRECSKATIWEWATWNIGKSEL